MTDGCAGLKVVAILEAANRSLTNGGHREALPGNSRHMSFLWDKDVPNWKGMILFCSPMF